MMSKTPLLRLLEDHVIRLDQKEYQLTVINSTELKDYRLGGYSGLVMTEVKNGEKKIWFTLLDSKNIRLSSQKWINHACSNDNVCCARLSASRDPKGCACIRDRTISAYISEGFTRREAYKIGFRSEKYDFIECAVETFNMTENGFKVIKCSNFYHSINQCIMTDEEKKNEIVKLAQFLNPDIKTFEDIRNKI